MIPVDMTTFGGPDASPPTERGDCLRASIASLFHLESTQVPHFSAEDRPWSESVNEWLEPRGLVAVPYGIAAADEPPAPLIRVGPSPRGEWAHAVVVDADGQVHDPHPSRAGLDEREGQRYVILFLPRSLSEGAA